MQRIATIATIAAATTLLAACGHTDKEPAGAMGVSEPDTRTVSSGEGIELAEGQRYRLTFDPVASIEERSESCDGEVIYREVDVTTHTVEGAHAACVVVYCASGCSSVDVEVDRL